MTSHSLQEIVPYGTMSLRVGPIHSAPFLFDYESCFPITPTIGACLIHVACTYPESFVRGGPTLTSLFFNEGKEDLNTI